MGSLAYLQNLERIGTYTCPWERQACVGKEKQKLEQEALETAMELE
jgi:hypothetical protein